MACWMGEGVLWLVVLFFVGNSKLGEGVMMKLMGTGTDGGGGGVTVDWRQGGMMGGKACRPD
jgi:hypothetical protein